MVTRIEGFTTFPLGYSGGTGWRSDEAIVCLIRALSRWLSACLRDCQVAMQVDRQVSSN